MDSQQTYKVDLAPSGGWFVLRRNERPGRPWQSWTAIESHDEREDAERRVRELRGEDT